MANATPQATRTVELAVQGMDCAECTQHVQRALSGLAGVEGVQVYLAAEKAVIRYDPARADMEAWRAAVAGAGYALQLPMQVLKTVHLKIVGMDCAECTEHVHDALVALPGVADAQVYLASEKAVVRYDPARVDRAALGRAVASAGYAVAPELAEPTGTGRDGPGAAGAAGVGQGDEPAAARLSSITRPILTIFALVFGAVLLVVVGGEWLGWFARLTDLVPQPVGWALVLLAGAPIFATVIRAALRRQVISHTLMSIGVLAALLVGQWPTAAVVVFFMHVGNFAERFTTERSRRAVKQLTSLAPTMARVERDGHDVEVPLGAVHVGDVALVRPGEAIPVDGDVLTGHATVNQAAITGESMPVEVSPGSHVYAATLATLGSLRVRTEQVGAESTFGRVVRLVEEAEAHRAEVQRVADRFSAYFLPVVATIAALTFVLRRDPLATAAVLVVACSCSLALATPVAMLASIGAAARRGLLIKGGKYLELLARADVVLVDKTGTLTWGTPRITDVVSLGDATAEEVVRLAASAERDSEHPLAEAARIKASQLGVALDPVEEFTAIPGQGVRARLAGSRSGSGSRNGSELTVGNARLVPAGAEHTEAARLEAAGKTLLFVARDGELIGLLAAADTVRPEVRDALGELRRYGVRQIEMLTGDNERVAAALAATLDISFAANVLPEDKIERVRAYQAQGHTVVMVGDGVNDAPALAQADVGIVMGVAGTDVALEAAHMALMRDDWRLVPEVFAIAHRTMRVVKMNLGFTALYNVVGLSLAALGILPPILAAAAQSLPDLGIVGNSARLLRGVNAEVADGSDRPAGSLASASGPARAADAEAMGSGKGAVHAEAQ
jgi:Cu+-exporting ATPase